MKAGSVGRESMIGDSPKWQTDGTYGSNSGETLAVRVADVGDDCVAPAPAWAKYCVVAPQLGDYLYVEYVADVPTVWAAVNDMPPAGLSVPGLGRDCLGRIALAEWL
jgi:hypothetical protein